MKTFTNLIEDVQKPGLCHRCGGCVTFCTAINYGALELDSEGKALEQIKARRYYEKYLNSGDTVYLIGVEFSREQRNVVGFEWEEM